MENAARFGGRIGHRRAEAFDHLADGALVDHHRRVRGGAGVFKSGSPLGLQKRLLVVCGDPYPHRLGPQNRGQQEEKKRQAGLHHLTLSRIAPGTGPPETKTAAMHRECIYMEGEWRSR
jgi:hypothetical protein